MNNCVTCGRGTRFRTDMYECYDCYNIRETTENGTDESNKKSVGRSERRVAMGVPEDLGAGERRKLACLANP